MLVKSQITIDQINRQIKNQAQTMSGGSSSEEASR